jgi:nicotinamide mononucleotide (NMN) deamidase PncC
MSNLAELGAVVSELRKERANQANELKHLDAALAVLGKLGGGSSSTKSGHAMSAAGRRRISLAQKARWARARAHNVVSIAPKRGKRTISAAGRRRIAAAQRARWAKVRAGKK